MSEATRRTLEGSPARKRGVRILAWLVALVGAYAVVAGALLPWALRGFAERRISGLTGGVAHIGQLKFQPFAWRLAVRDFALGESNGQPFLAWSNLVVDAQVSSLWRGEAHLREVVLERPAFHLRRAADGELNVLAWMTRLQTATTNAPATKKSTNFGSGFAVTLEDLRVVDGELVVRDEALKEPFTSRFAPVNFRLEGLTTRADAKAPLHLHAHGAEGQQFLWDGSLSLNPLVATGLVRVLALPLPRYGAYESLVSPLVTTSGVAQVEVPYQLRYTNQALVAAVTGARLAVTNLQVRERATAAPFAELASLAVEGVEAGWPAKVLRVGRVELLQGQLHARRSASGQSNLRGVVKPQVIQDVVRDLTDWRLELGELRIQDLAAEYQDATFEPPLAVAVDQIQVGITGVSNATNAPTPARAEVTGRWQGAGTWKATAEAKLFPAHARAEVQLTDWHLESLRAVVAKYARLTLNRGRVSATLQARYGHAETPSAGTPLVAVTGGVQLQDFAATDARTGLDFIRWENVGLEGLDLALEPNHAALEALVVQRLQTSLVLMTNGQINVLEMIGEAKELGERAAGAESASPSSSAPTTAVAQVPESTAPSGTTGASAGASPLADWPLRVGAVKLDGVSLFARDDFYGGGFKTSVESLDGEIRQITLPATTEVAVDLRGRLTALSGFTLAGTLRPDPARFAADLRLTTERASLAQFTPYSVRFAGYPITQGELTAQVHYHVEGNALKAENALVLNQFTLGPKTPSPDAVNLPLKLGVALLKDREGRIQLDVPLTGSLDDPKFRLGPILWQALKNIVLKAATAPFALLGSLFGSKETLEFVEFTPGSSALPAAQTNRVATLAKALRERPQLQLAILAGFDVDADKQAVAVAKLDGRLRTLRAEELVAAGQPTNTVEVTAAERPRLLATLYARDFGTATNNVAAPANSIVNGAPAPALDAAALETRLVQTTEVSPGDLTALAQARAEAVRDFLVTGGEVESGRVGIETATGAENPSEGKARVTFRLE